MTADLLLLAHAGAHPIPWHQVPTWWTWDPLPLCTLTFSALLYALGLSRLWGRAGVGRGVSLLEAGLYLAGWLTLVLALLSPLDALSDILFSAHMGQHELLMLVAAPLLVLGRPLLVYLWAMPAPIRAFLAAGAQRPAVSRLWRWMTEPAGILVAHAIVLWVWHVPALFEAALRSEAIHAVQHALFFVTAALFWWSLSHGRYGRMGYGAAVVFVFITAGHSGLLGAMLTLGRKLWYPLYQVRGEAWQVDALEDQRLAGLIMWVPSGVLLLVGGLALFAAWMGESERRTRTGGAVQAAIRPEQPSP